MLDSKERTGFVGTYVEKIKCNSREYVAICVDTEGASTSKKGGKRSGRGRRAILETTQFFNNRYPKSNATRMMDCG